MLTLNQRLALAGVMLAIVAGPVAMLWLALSAHEAPKTPTPHPVSVIKV